MLLKGCEFFRSTAYRFNIPIPCWRTLIFLHVAGWAGTLGTKGKPGLSHKRQSDIGWILIEWDHILSILQWANLMSRKNRLDIWRRWVLHLSRQLKKQQKNMHACNVHVHGMRARHASAKESYVLHVSTQLDFWLLYNSAVGAPLFCSSSWLWSSPSFPAHLPHNTQMSQGAAEDGGWGWGGGQEAAAACHKWTSVCVQRLEKERYKQKFRRRSSCGSCGCLIAKDAGQLECADWPARTGGCVLAVACFLFVILNEKSDNSSGTGCPIERQIPWGR